MKHKSILVAMSVLLVLGFSAGFVAAADFPTKPLTLVNPSQVGGSTDVLGRMWAGVAEKYLGQPVVVVNKTGGGGALGLIFIRDAKPDGYNLSLISSGRIPPNEWEIVNGRKPPVDFDEFRFIGAMSNSPILVVVPFDRPWKTLGELLEYAKKTPVSYCSGGLYGSSHIPIEMVLRAAGIKIPGTRHVPYQGGGPCLQALSGGHFDMATQFPSTSIPLMRGKKLKILAVLWPERISSLPDVPTAKELGLDAIYSQAQAIAVPLKTPDPIVEKLKKAFKQTCEDPQYIKMVEDLGDEVRASYGEEVMKEWGEIRRRTRALFVEVLKENPPEQKSK